MRSKQAIERQIAHFRNDCANKGTEANAVWIEALEWVLGDEEHQRAYKEFLKLDETLLAPRRVRRLVPDDDGGYLADLACGHQIWIVSQPALEVCCGHCLNILIHQIREIQAQQRSE